MTALAWQTLLLLGLAYLLGCWIACLVRRMIGVRDMAPAMRAEPAVVGAAAGAGAALEAQRRAAEPAPMPARQAPVAPPVPMRDAFRRADTLEPAAEVARPAPVAPAAPPAPRPAAAAVPAAPVTPPAPRPAAAPPVIQAPHPATPRSLDVATRRFENALNHPAAAEAASRPAPSPLPMPAAPVTEAKPVRAEAPPQPSPAVAEGAAVAAAAAAAAAAAMASSKPAAAPAGSAGASVRAERADDAASRPAQTAPAPVTVPADDLKRIRGIDGAIESELRKLGIARFADIGAWKPQDVARVSGALGFKGRIESENWIEQAQILAAGGETHYSGRLARGEIAAARPVADEGQRAAPPVLQPIVPPAIAQGAPQATVAPAPAARTGPAEPAAPVIAQRSAIEAAAAAAAALAAAAAAARTDSAPRQPAPVAPSAAPAAPTPASAPAVSDNAAFATPRQTTSAPAAQPPAMAGMASAARSAVGSHRDALQRIGGVTPEIEKLLNVQGVTRYAQMASWSSVEVERFDRLLGYQGRIRRENWIEQAHVLARDGETAYSREFDRRSGQGETKPAPVVGRVQAPSTRVPETPAPAAVPSSLAPGSALGQAVTAAAAAAAALSEPAASPAETPRPQRLADAIRVSETRTSGEAVEKRTPDLSGFRSVRSEAFRSGNAAPSPNRTSEPHDLKRIRGIGVLIEKKLNSMGITHYEQIAEWTVADIERISHVLDFKGRIERENWVEQARILASGGQTEFSRRADRGDLGG